jgi:uncharacterized protein
MSRQNFTHLGFGLGFRPCHYEDILTNRPKAIDWLEVITENFLAIGGKPRRILEQARAHYPIAIHGVGLSIGSPDAVNKTYLAQLTDLIHWLKPALISDHLCFTKFNQHNSHDLLPVQYTRSILERVCLRVDLVQQAIGRRILLENPSAYVTYGHQDMAEVDFFCELVQRTGCGVLLDVNNLYVNQMNLGQDPLQYISQLPKDCVGQIHIAGHSVETSDLGTVRIDTHDHAIENDVWRLYQHAAHKWPEASPMIEWDDHIPVLTDLIQMLNVARNLPPLKLPETAPKLTKSSDLNPSAESPKKSADFAHGEFFSMTVDSAGLEADDTRLAVLADDVFVPRLLGARVYNGAYFSRLHDVIKDEYPTLAGVTTEEGFAEIVACYLAAHPPSDFNVGQLGADLGDFLEQGKHGPLLEIDFGTPLNALGEITKLDRARNVAFTHSSSVSAVSKSALGEISPEQWEVVRFGFTPTLQRMRSQYTISPVWQAVNKGLAAERPAERAETIAVWRHDESTHHAPLAGEEALMLALMLDGASFAEATATLSQKSSDTMEVTASRAIQYLVQWFDRGFITHINA